MKRWRIEDVPVDTLLLWAFIALACLVIIALLGRLAFGEHTVDTRWIRRYSTAAGFSCCGDHDCRAVPVRLVEVSGEKTTVEILGVPVTLPSKSVHQSETVQTWWCAKTFESPPSVETTRCVFYSFSG